MASPSETSPIDKILASCVCLSAPSAFCCDLIPALLAEIKEISDQKCEEDDMLMSLFAGYRHPLMPHLEFEYPNEYIHEDIYKLIKCSCIKVCTSEEQVDKVMMIWTNFIERMLGVPQRAESIDSVTGNQNGNYTRALNYNATQGGDGIRFLLPSSQLFLQAAKPITKWDPQSHNLDRDSQIFFGNDTFYMLVRLQYILYERILKTKLYSSSVGDEEDTSTKSYARFMDALYNLLEGSSDNAIYEDDCNANFGPQSYPLFTLDKLIYKIVKQLQNISTDEISNQLLQLHEYEASRGRFDVDCYGDNARVILHDKNTYLIQSTPTSMLLTIQLMNYWFDNKNATAVYKDPNFEAHKEDFLAVVPENRVPQGIFLERNMRKYGRIVETSALEEACEDLLMYNGLEIRISSSSSRALYVLGTEDFMMRRKKKKNLLHQNGSSNGHAGPSNGHAGPSNGHVGPTNGFH